MSRDRRVVGSRFGAFVALGLAASTLAVVPAGATAAKPKVRTVTARPAALHAPTVTPGEVTAGGIVTVAGAKCTTETGPTSVFVSLVSSKGALVATGSGAPQPNGTWSVALTVPPSAKAGAYDIDSTCDQYNSEFFYPVASVTVDAATSVWTEQVPPTVTSPNGNLNSVSCRGASDCVAVGFGINAAGDAVPVAATWNGATWAEQTLAVPAGGGFGVLNGVSCAGTTCVAVGRYRTKQGTQSALIERNTGSGWSADTAANPKGGSAVELRAVSCGGVGACVAVGVYTRNGVGTVPFSDVAVGATWSVHAAVLPDSATTGELDAVSCKSINACMATGLANNAALAEFWNGSSWALESPKFPASAGSSALGGVSCAGTQCIAVGWYDDQNGFHPVSQHFNGSTWTRLDLPAPANGDYGQPSAVSCVSATSCTLVGSYLDTNSFETVPLAEHWNGTKWSVQAAVQPANATLSQLSAVSCAGNACLAVGAYNNAGGAARSFSEHSTGASWTVQATPRIAGARSSQLNGVACGSATACVAVGWYEKSTGGSELLADTWNGTSWAVEPITAGPGGGALNGVSCATATSCTAVGYTGSDFFGQGPIVEHWDGASWSLQPFPTPPRIDDGELTGVSCTSPTFCTAVGWGFNFTDFRIVQIAATWNGAKWKLQKVPTPSQPLVALSAVSCATASSCIAVGSDLEGLSDSPPFVESWNGSKWSLVPTTAPPGLFAVSLSGVSCSAVDSCMAVGSGSTPGGQAAAVAEHWNGQKWTVLATATGARGGLLQGVACRSATECTAVGTVYQYGPVGTAPLVETWNGASWTAQRVPDVTGATSSGLTSVSCPAASVCVAVGNQSRGVPVPLAESEGTG